MKNTWLISDTHFFHKGVEEWCARPANYVEQILSNWKKLVQLGDVVYHLGDVIFRTESVLSDILDDLPGIKILVKGNHDKKASQWYLEHGFHAVCTSIILDVRTKFSGTYYDTRKVLLSHKPMDIPEGADLNIFGHFHNAAVDRWEKDLVEKLTDKHYLFVLEDMKYRPILLDRAVRDGLVKKVLERF